MAANSSRVGRARAVVGVADAELVGVAVRGAGDLPAAERRRVRLAGPGVAEVLADQIGLGRHARAPGTSRSVAHERRVGRGHLGRREVVGAQPVHPPTELQRRRRWRRRRARGSRRSALDVGATALT